MRLPLILTSIHGGSSIVLLVLARLMPMLMPSGRMGGAIVYMSALLVYTINQPGLITIIKFYKPSALDPAPLIQWMFALAMILVTEIYLFLLLAIVGWIHSRLSKARSASA